MQIHHEPPPNFLGRGKQLKEANKGIATLLAFLLIPMSGLVTDMYLPSMPQMALDLTQNEAAIQLTLSLFLISYGLAQFITGNLLDAFGRYRLGLLSLVAFIVSSLVVTTSSSIIVVDAMRIIQGLSTGFIVVAKRAFFVDVYEGERRKHYLSLMSIVWSAAPVLAPFVGGYLQHFFSWRANFFVLAGYGLVMLLLEWAFSGETIRAFRQLKWKTVFQDYRFMFQDRLFVSGLLICGLSYGTTMIFGLSGSFIIEHKLQYSPVVAGYAALAMGLAWMTGGFLGKATLDRPLLPKLRLSNLVQLALTLLMIVTALYWSNLYSLLLFAFLIHVCVGFIFNNYFAICLGRFPQFAGVVSGLCGGVTFIVTAASSYSVIGWLHPEHQQGMGIAYLLMGIGAFSLLQFVLKPYITSSVSKHS